MVSLGKAWREERLAARELVDMLKGEWTDAERAVYPAGSAREPAIEIIRDLAALEALEDEWTALARDIPSPLTQFDWAFAAAHAFRRDELFIVTVREGGVLRAVAPLVLKSQGFTRVLEFLGHELCEPQQLVGHSERHLAFLAKALARLPHPLIFRKFPADHPAVDHFRRASPLGLKIVAPSDSQDSWLRFGAGEPDLESRMSTGRRKALRRALRMAERLGAVQFRFLRPDVGALAPLLGEIFRVESSGWKGRNGTGLLHNPEQALFYRTLCDRAAHRGVLRLGFLTIGTSTAAVRIDMIWGGSSWELKIGYDEEFYDCSPGLLLSHEALKCDEADGLIGHHFLGDGETWHETWAVNRAKRVTLRYYPLSPSGGVALMRDVTSRLRMARNEMTVPRKPRAGVQL